MIKFSWSLIGDDRFQIQVKTPQTRVGTLHRLTAAIYVFGLDIVSGNVMTEEENGELFSHDNFVLRIANAPEHHSIYETTSKLGGLMESLLDPALEPAELLRQHGRPEPETSRLSSEDSRVEFTDIPARNMTRLYIQVTDRTGLLYHVTRVLAQESVNIWSAVILTTDTGITEDAFYVQYADGPLDEAKRERVRALIVG